MPAENRKMLLEKYVSGKIPALKNSRFLCQNTILFLDEETFIKRSYELREEFNTRVQIDQIFHTVVAYPFNCKVLFFLEENCFFDK